MSYQAKLILQELKSSIDATKRSRKTRENFPQILENLKSKIEFLEDHLSKGSRYEKDVFTIADCYRKALECLRSKNHHLADTAEQLITSDYPHIGNMSAAAKRFIGEYENNLIGETIDLRNGDPDGNFRLKKIKSRSQLATMGKKFDNCLKDSEQLDDYYRRMQLEQLEVWLLLKDDRPFRLISLNTHTREIEDFEQTKDKDEFWFPSHSLAIEILKKLNACADSYVEFAKIGAFRVFLSNQPMIEAEVIGNRLIWVWRYTDEIIVALKDEEQVGDDLHWSRFYRERQAIRRRRSRYYSQDDSEWLSDRESHLNLSDLFELVLQYPKLTERLNKQILRTND